METCEEPQSELQYCKEHGMPVLITAEELQKAGAGQMTVLSFGEKYPNGLHANGPDQERAEKDGMGSNEIYQVLGLTGAARTWNFDRPGRCLSVTWYRNGVRHDPAGDFAAVTTWHRNGERRSVEHYHHGKKHDPPSGTAAVKQWEGNGKLDEKIHYTEGVRQ